MKHTRWILALFIIIGLSACDTSLQKATQQVLVKGELDTPTPNPPEIEEKTPATEDCPQQDPHPLGSSIADKFSVSYDEVMNWYCDGYLFEDILLALQTSQLSDATPEELFTQLETNSWEEIWAELDIVSMEE